MAMLGPDSTSDELRAAAEEITALLKGPMSNVERAWLVEDRRDIRAELAKRESKTDAA